MSTVDLLAAAPVRWALGATLLSAAGLATGRLAGRNSPTTRHAANLLGLVAALALPAVAAAVPQIDVVVGSVVAATGGAAVRPSPAALGSIAGAAWSVVALLLIARIVRRVGAVRDLARRADEVTAPKVTSELRSVCEQLGLRAVPRVVTHASVATPSVWGIRSPFVLLPRGAARWSCPRLRAVLLHECAHLSRSDPLTQLVAEFACAVYWFVPFTWWAAAAMRREREIACDDRVILSGARPSGYASLLVGWRRAHTVPGILAALRGASLLEARVAALLSADRRTGGDSVRMRTLGSAAGAALVLALAVVRPVVEARPAPDLPPLARAAPVAPPSPSVALPPERSPSPASGPVDGAPPGVEAGPSSPDPVARSRSPLPMHTVGGGPPPPALLDEAFAQVAALTGGALRSEPGRGLTVDVERLREALGLPEDARVQVVAVPYVTVRVQGRR